MKNALTQERLKELLHYDPNTGDFVWLANKARAKIGNIAGCCKEGGYRQIKIDGTMHLAHRLAWLYVHGTFPEKGIDHFDGNPSNNRTENLREATQSENMENQRKARSNNISGVFGAHWSKDKQKWYSRIVVKGIKNHLGYFATPELASAAYLTAKAALHPFGTISNEVTE